jgi:FkbM family methyltransferase
MVTPEKVLTTALDRVATALRPLVPPDSRLRPALKRIRQRLADHPGLDPLNRVILEFGRAHPAAVFVQIGANDGEQRDPLRAHIADRGWSGVMVEPVPYVFERLQANYEGHPRVRLENVAIADTDGTRPLYYLPQSTDDQLPQWYDALASFRPEVILKHDWAIPDVAERLSSIDVKCWTFDTLYRTAGLDHLDVVQIDTEGFDFEVIKLIDLEKYAPTLLMFEHLHLGEEERAACLDHVRRHGYEDLSDGMDTVCLRRAQLGRPDRRLLRTWDRLRAEQAAGHPVRPAWMREVRRAVNRPLERLGWQLVRQVPSGNGEVDHRLFNPHLHSDPDSLPAGAAEVLRADNPRLVELRRRYGRLVWPVGIHSRWEVERVGQWLNLQYFRGDNIIVWHYREDETVARLRFFTFLRYVTERDRRGLLASLGEDGAFGCWTYEFPGYARCSRDLLDSVNELLFLDRALSVFDESGLRVLDIGAGYGRLAHRASQALPGLASWCCVDAVPESTFLSEYYLGYRGVMPPVHVAALDEVPDLGPGLFDLAVNVHSFSECTRGAIDWWMAELERLRVPRLFLVPNEPSGFLSTETDGTRLDYLPVLESHGYNLVTEELVFDDPAVRDLMDVHDRFCLFELER